MKSVHSKIDLYKYDKQMIRIGIKLQLWESNIISTEVWDQMPQRLTAIVFSRTPNKQMIQKEIHNEISEAFNR